MEPLIDATCILCQIPWDMQVGCGAGCALQRFIESPPRGSGGLKVASWRMGLGDKGLSHRGHCLCLCQRIPVVKNLKAEALKWCLSPLPLFKFHPSISYRIKLRENLFSFYCPSMKDKTWISIVCSCSGCYGRYKGNIDMVWTPGLYSLVEDAQRKTRDYKICQVHAI